MVKTLIRIEGLSISLLSLFLYSSMADRNWLIFLLFLLLPDVSISAYVINKKIGSIIYNLVHTYTLAIGLLFLGYLVNNNLIITLGLAFAAHIGIDRLIGFGLKYPNSFKETHIQKV